jgi:hypothetical protein
MGEKEICKGKEGSVYVHIWQQESYKWKSLKAAIVGMYNSLLEL